MADQQQKNGNHAGRPASSGAPKRMTQAPAETSTGTDETWSDAPETSRGASGSLMRASGNNLVAVRTASGFAASPANAIHETLKQMEDIEILRRLHPRDSGAGRRRPARRSGNHRRADGCQRAEACAERSAACRDRRGCAIETGLSDVSRVARCATVKPDRSRAAPAPRGPIPDSLRGRQPSPAQA